MRLLAASLLFAASTIAVAGPYAPAAGEDGSTAVRYDDPSIIAWASAVGQIVRGPYDITDEESPLANFGNPATAPLGPANGFDTSSGEPTQLNDPNRVISLGDGGIITLLFPAAIFDGPSWDFAVFENAFNNTFLELAFVEVFDGDTWARFPTDSLTQTDVQIDQTTANNGIQPSDIDGFAGKYRVAWGTPFDLSVIADHPGLDVNHIVAVRLVDVVGIVDSEMYSSVDSSGDVVNDPWPTPFGNGGFDLDAVGVMHLVPEPSTFAVGALGWLLLATRRDRSRRRP